MRLKNLQIGYQLPKNILAWQNVLNNVKFTITGRNLFTITNYKGSNPAGYNGDGDATGGIDCGTYPTPRTFTFGARFNF